MKEEDISESSTEELMPWESASKANPVSSVEMRQLLAQYLKLVDIEKPSLLHSLVLFQVVKYYSNIAASTSRHSFVYGVLRICARKTGRRLRSMRFGFHRLPIG